MNVGFTIPVCQAPEEIVFLPDSSKAFISCSSANEIAVVQLQREVPAPASAPSATPAAKPTSPKTKPTNSDKHEKPPTNDDPLNQNPYRLITLLNLGKT